MTARCLRKQRIAIKRDVNYGKTVSPLLVRALGIVLFHLISVKFHEVPYGAENAVSFRLRNPYVFFIHHQKIGSTVCAENPTFPLPPSLRGVLGGVGFPPLSLPWSYPMYQRRIAFLCGKDKEGVCNCATATLNHTFKIAVLCA